MTQAFLAIPFGCLCLYLFMALKGEADKARGTTRFYVVALFRSIALAVGVLALMLGVSRLLSGFFS